MSRMEKYGSRRARANLRQQEPNEETHIEEDENGLPPRRKQHPSNKQQTAQIFYNALIFILMILIVTLFWFGKQSNSPS
ncbi:hypothetical protein DFQ01_104141 [Paenibacillus cellulosilyticus]|uniref:Uncharacterized protein n=1 Tax=Paenibacillus cellulosilyticus TaxID=375489 RepID=A0A2V2YW50_9BACL|nr:hypothetical protein DFQ01_104141 [Paenibacillus cellulosilyticus]